MSMALCVINIFKIKGGVSTFVLRRDIEEFLIKRKGEIQGSGRSCMDFSYSDIEVKFRSENTAHRAIKELEDAFSEVCEIDVEWL